MFLFVIFASTRHKEYIDSHSLSGLKLRFTLQTQLLKLIDICLCMLDPQTES